MCCSVSGQETEIFSAIKEKGMAYVSSLKQGKIENLKNQNPPKNTWTYEKLLEYKEALERTEDITYGSFIAPSKRKGIYGFNFFAMSETDEISYFFVAVISMEVIDEKDVKIENAYLFTEKSALKNWWQRAFAFYEGDDRNKIPKQFLYPICPPPPFRD